MNSSELLGFQHMDIDEIRRVNLCAEALRLGGDGKLATTLGVHKNRIYQWARAIGDQRRNISKKNARLAERELGRAPGWLDIEHGKGPTSPSAEALDARPQNNVMALRIAVQSLCVVLSKHSPEIAEEVAQDIVATANEMRFGRQAFLGSLIGFLRGASLESEAGAPSLPPAPVSSKSKRGRAG
jgi:hypothetical protein